MTSYDLDDYLRFFLMTEIAIDLAINYQIN